MTVFSQTMAVINPAGVTSNAGLKTPTPSGALAQPWKRVTSRGLRSSMGISSPLSIEKSKLERGATTSVSYTHLTLPTN